MIPKKSKGRLNKNFIHTMGGLGQRGWKEVPDRPGGFIPAEELKKDQPTPEEMAAVSEKIEKHMPLTEAEELIAEHMGIDVEAPGN